VRELSALRTALEEGCASLRNFWVRERTLPGLLTPLFGILTNTLDACATWDSEDQTAPFKSAHPVLTFFWEVETTREETALEEESVITVKVFANASLDTMEPDANSKLSLVKELITFGGGRLFNWYEDSMVGVERVLVNFGLFCVCVCVFKG